VLHSVMRGLVGAMHDIAFKIHQLVGLGGMVLQVLGATVHA
jgi:hypothetical protein